jgi:hypothetical protein
MWGASMEYHPSFHIIVAIIDIAMYCIAGSLSYGKHTKISLGKESKLTQRRLLTSIMRLQVVGLSDANTTVHPYEYYRLIYRHQNDAVPQ